MDKPYRLSSGYAQQGLEVDYRDLIKTQAQVDPTLVDDVTAGGNTTITNIFNTSPGASVFIASGPSHASGLVPDPGSTAGTTRFLREDATWVAGPDPFDIISRYKKRKLFMPDSTPGQITGYGGTNPGTFATGTGSPGFGTYFNGVDEYFVSYTTGDTSGNEAGMRQTTNSNYFQNMDSISFHITTGSAITSQRIWLVIYDAGGGEIGGGDTGGGEMIGWRYSTGVPDTNWQCVTSTVALGVSVTDSGVAVAANTEYKLTTRRTALGTAAFYINGVVVATKNAPLSSAGRIDLVLRTLTAASRTVRVGNVEVIGL